MPPMNIVVVGIRTWVLYAIGKRGGFPARNATLKGRPHNFTAIFQRHRSSEYLPDSISLHLTTQQ